tara:strand:- start:55 stop:471 length:417 start_codon:yes stop_codon:yes gene_type:complete
MSDFRPSPFQTNESVKFGDASDDAHEVVGSFELEGPISFSKITTSSATSITATVTDSVIFCSNSTANSTITVTLPTASAAGEGSVLFIKVVDSGAHTLTLESGSTDDKIDGANTKTFSAALGTGVILLSNGDENWHIF